MATYTKVKGLSLLRFIHGLIPIKHKLDFFITRYLYSSEPIAIRYFGGFYICTSVTNLNRSTISELIWEGSGSQPEISLIKRLQKQLADDIHFIDVGGNIGSFMWQFAKKCTYITIFEPIPRLNRVIEDSILYNNVNKINLISKALGDHPDVVKMFDNNNSNVVEDNDLPNTIHVPVSTLDIELKDKEKIDFIKIDVEGFELKVLKGGIQTIKRHKPHFLIKIHPAFIQNYGNNYIEVIDFIEQFGYNIAYYSFLNERRLPRFQRILNRWAGNPGRAFTTKQEFMKDVAQKPELLSYHLYCEPK